jgi:hypothetical protein
MTLNELKMDANSASDAQAMRGSGQYISHRSFKESIVGHSEIKPRH